MAEIVSVISGKGGTGKTSLCAAVASCLAAGGARVLCIDADVGLRNLDISLGMSDEPILPFTAVMRGEYPLEKASVHPRLAGLRVLTAPITESAEALDAGQFARLLRQAYSTAKISPRPMHRPYRWMVSGPSWKYLGGFISSPRKGKEIEE